MGYLEEQITSSDRCLTPLFPLYEFDHLFAILLNPNNSSAACPRLAPSVASLAASVAAFAASSARLAAFRAHTPTHTPTALATAPRMLDQSTIFVSIIVTKYKEKSHFLRGFLHQ